MWRTKDGYFISSNFARDPAVIRDETSGFDPQDVSTSPNARRVRWEQLMKQSKGQIDVEHGGELLWPIIWIVSKREEQANRRSLVRSHRHFAREASKILGVGCVTIPAARSRARRPIAPWQSVHEFSRRGRGIPAARILLPRISWTRIQTIHGKRLCFMT